MITCASPRRLMSCFATVPSPVTPEVLKDLCPALEEAGFARFEEKSALLEPPVKPEPRGGLQIEALYYLKQARTEGVDKGIVVAATGVGKTHLAAFDALPFERVLFLSPS